EDHAKSTRTEIAESSRPAPAAAPAGGEHVVIPTAEYQQLIEDMRKMKVIIKGHEKRIKMLEDQVKQLETDVYTPGPTGSEESASQPGSGGVTFGGMCACCRLQVTDSDLVV